MASRKRRMNSITAQPTRSAGRMRPRTLSLETLEDRRLLAPVLSGIDVNDGTLLQSGDVRAVAPTELTFRFNPGEQIDPTTLAAGISVVRSGADGVFGSVDDVPITPGFLGIGAQPNQVVMRFASALPDDRYQITVFGTGSKPITNIAGEPLNDGARDSVTTFELDLGAKVVAVVPQPISRTGGGVLTQARDQIVVYFNDDNLNPTSAQNPQFYQLIFTGHSNQFDNNFNTARNLDDVTFTPTSVVYDAGLDQAILTFASDLSSLSSGPGTYRLRIGTNEARPAAPVVRSVVNDPGGGVSSAFELGALNGSLIASEFIGGGNLSSGALSIQYPGANDDPGSQPLPIGEHVLGSADTQNGIPTFRYNFRSVYGRDGQGIPLINRITEGQKTRAREVFDLYSHYTGIQFEETTSDGITVVTGDVRVISALISPDPQSTPGAAGYVRDTSDGKYYPTAVMNAGGTWTETFGANWFQVAMQQIGSLLGSDVSDVPRPLVGLGEVRDLPPGTIMGSDAFLQFERPAEPVFPGDNDIVHAQHLFRPDGDDVDFYRFTLTTSGDFTAETVAERQPPGSANPTSRSSLDSVVRLYRQTNSGGVELVAQNDDYFSNDSFLRLSLNAGTYFVGVSSTGNDQYNPLTGAGGGGTSQGGYDLRLGFRAGVNSSIVDATGKRLDGDGDGMTGGVFNFWFRAETAGNTLIVDKTAASGGTGSLASPFQSITAAMNAASAGDIVRVVGNHLEDGVLTNYVPYQIGFSSLEAPLPDGGSDGMLRVKSGVTLMIDEGVVLKSRRGAIIVGSSSNSVDNSAGAIQILGTPANRVYLTSLNDEELGTDTTTLPTSPARGDWGGIQIRGDFDTATNKFNYEQSGIFLNYVNQADMRYGGGIVSLNSVSQVVNAVTMIDARPTVTNSSISFTADAAMAANPNSFAETTFHEPEFQSVRFTSDYTRVGPEISDNTIVNNTTNGIFVGVPTPSSFSSRSITSSTRWDDTDIVHVVTDALLITGGAGGNIISGGTAQARLDGGLVIDAGTVVKLEGGRFEVNHDGHLYAEGNSIRPVIFTSQLDDRFGAGGTFNTNNDSTSMTSPTPGDWGGFFLGPMSEGSFDHARILYGGGEAPIEGDVVDFNVLEIYQARARVVNSVFEQNGSGIRDFIIGDRAGRGANEDGTIFVRAAQPVIVGNAFTGNLGPIINVNVNSLNYFGIVDHGRATAEVDRIDQFADNQGALIRNNIVTSNGINGMVVRGGTLTTEGVWDDTDIVHVVRDGVYVPNVHAYGGLRLQSSISESLVVKFLGETAGITSTGSAFGIPDHIGGAFQIAGQPGHPVVLTSFYDDSVGSGVDAAGRVQADTDGLGRPLRAPVESAASTFGIQINFGPNIQLFPEAKEAVRQAADIWEERLQDNATVVIDVDLSVFTDAAGMPINSDLLLDPITYNRFVRLFDTTPVLTREPYANIRNAMIADAGPHESLLNSLPTFDNLDVQLPQNVVVPFETIPFMDLTRANAKSLGFANGGSGPVVPSAYDSRVTSIDGTILINSNTDLFDFDRKDGLLTYREDFQSHFLREIGEVLGFYSSVDFVDFRIDVPADPAPTAEQVALAPLDMFRFAPGVANSDFATATRLLDPTAADHVFYAGGNIDLRDWPLEGIERGEIPISRGRRVGDELNDFGLANRWLDDVFTRNGKRFELDTIGVMDPQSYLRDEVVQLNDSFQTTQGLINNLSEADLLAFDSIGWDVVGPGPGDWLGLAVQQLSHDGNISFAGELEPASGAVGIGNSTTSTAEFLGILAPNRFSGDDNIRLGFEAHGILSDANDVDVYSFSAVAGTDVWLDIDGTAPGLNTALDLISSDGTILAGSDDSLREAATPNSPTLLGIAQPLDTTDIYTKSPLDAGMKLTLPGPAGVQDTYYVRVSGVQNSSGGRYELQVRLQAADVVPGVSIEYADIRFAESGVTIVGPPVQSPLLGDQAEDESINDYFDEANRVYALNEEGFVVPDSSVSLSQVGYDVSAQNVGDLLSTRKGAVSIFGTLEGPGQGDDVDWYRFEVAGDSAARAFADGEGDIFDFFNLLQRPTAVVLDIDYAVPNTNIALYQATGFNTPPDPLSASFSTVGLEFVAFGQSSNVAADQAATSGSVDVLQSGSFTTEDPFIGPLILFPGVYYVAVASEALVPEAWLDPAKVTSQIGTNDSRGVRIESLAVDDLGLYVPNPGFDFNDPVEGRYQLEIRILPDFNDANSGDTNRDRPQGQIIVANSSISNSRTYGVTVKDGFRNYPDYDGFIRQAELSVNNFRRQSGYRQDHGQFSTGDYVPAGGVPIALPGLNEERIIPGVTIENNVISGGLEGGIQVHGDPGGFILSTSNVETILDVAANDQIRGTDITLDDINRAQFTIWDHQRNQQTFQFTTDGTVDSPDFIAIRVDDGLPDPVLTVNELHVTSVPNPTLADMLMDEIEHAIRLSDLDIRVYRTRGQFPFFGDSIFGASVSTFQGSPVRPEVVPTGMGTVETYSYSIGEEYLYVEGAIEIGFTDVIIGSSTNPFCLDNNYCMPLITAQAAQQSSVPFARITNNTLVGRGGDLFDGNGSNDIGIVVEDNVSPTIINNIIANFETGIQADLSSNDDTRLRGTYVGGLDVLGQDAVTTQNLVDMAVSENGKLGLVGWSLDYRGRDFGPQDLDDVSDMTTRPTIYMGGRPTIVTANLYQGNRDNSLRIGQGSLAIDLTNTNPLFIDPANGNFFLQAGSRAIDSSLDFLAERSYLRELMNAVGLDSQGIAAPDTDSLGLKRIDDPSVEPPSGVGNNVFKDRGALERADFNGPRAVLIGPRDNDAAGADQDPAADAVSLPGSSIPFFELFLNDGASQSSPTFGSGIDDTSIDIDSDTLVTVTRDGVALTRDLDFTVAYNTTNDSILILPAAGLWPAGSRYVVALDNSAIRDRSGNRLQANTTDGKTQFIVSNALLLDYGDAPSPYPTLDAQNGARHTEAGGLFLGASISSESNGQPSPNADADSFDDGVVIASLFPGQLADVFVNASGVGFFSGWIDFDGQNGWGAGEQVFDDIRLVSGTNRLSFAVPDSGTEGATFARFRFSSVSGLGVTGAAPDGEVEDYRVVISENTWVNTDDPLDVNNDGSIAANDVNAIVTELNLRTFSNATTGQLPTTRPASALFLDPTGDGFVTPLDALRIINFINNPPASAPLTARETSTADGWLDESPADFEQALDDLAEDITMAWSRQGPLSMSHLNSTDKKSARDTNHRE